MNLRKANLADLITEKMEIIQINPNDLIIVRLPNGIPTKTTQMIGQSIVDSLRALNNDNPVLLLPYDINIQHLNEKDMSELGWIKDAGTTKCDTDDTRLPQSTPSSNVSILFNEQRKVRQCEVTEFIANTQYPTSNPPGANTSGYINTILF